MRVTGLTGEMLAAASNGAAVQKQFDDGEYTWLGRPHAVRCSTPIKLTLLTQHSIPPLSP